MKLIKSYKFWVSLAGAVGILAVSIGKIFGIEINADGIEEIIMGLCGILIVFGIVSKPKEVDKDIDSDNTENIDQNKQE